MKRHLKAWVEDSFSKVSVRQPQSIHLDELLDDEDATTVGRLLDVFRRFVDCDVEWNEFMPMMVIPLGSTDTLDTFVPDLDRLFLNWRKKGQEPPSLYLLNRKAAQLSTSYEEYRCPLDGSSLKEIDWRSGKCSAYYRCFRGRKERDAGWEFSRCIYFEYFPEILSWE